MLSESISKAASASPDKAQESHGPARKQTTMLSFFGKQKSLSDSNDTATKRVKSVPVDQLPVATQLRAPSPISLSPSKLREIEERKQEALQRMEAKRVARACEMERRCLGPSWLELLDEELEKPYLLRLKEFLQTERNRGVKIFPPEDQIYSWSRFCAFEDVKVVILGQDPYHNDGQAMGLAFSVPEPCRPLPPSLVNIYKELASEFPDGQFTTPKHGSLVGWARQGVLLLNATLTVRAHEPASHANRGWEHFTDRVIQLLASKHSGLVFLLWGNHAQKKGAIIDKQKHCILTAAHPSPLSASRGFFGCGHFRKANDYLQEHSKTPIDWNSL